jgi:hypothetical protein
MRHAKKILILGFVAFIGLMSVLVIGNKVNSLHSKNAEYALAKPSLTDEELDDVKDLTDYFDLAGNIGSQADLHANARLLADSVTGDRFDSVNGVGKQISVPEQEYVRGVHPPEEGIQAEDLNESYGFDKLRFKPAGKGSLGEAKAQIELVLKGGDAGGALPSEYKLGGPESWLILSVLVNKYKYGFSDKVRFSVTASEIDFSHQFSASDLPAASGLVLNEALPIGYVVPFREYWGYTFQQFIDLGSDARFDGNVDFRGHQIKNLQLSFDLSSWNKENIVSNYQIDSYFTLRLAGALPKATLISSNIPYGSGRNDLAVGLFGLYGGSYITGGDLGTKTGFSDSHSVVTGKLGEELDQLGHSPLLDYADPIPIAGTNYSYHEGNRGMNLVIQQGLLVGQGVSSIELANFDFSGVNLEYSATVNTDVKIVSNQWEAVAGNPSTERKMSVITLGEAVGDTTIASNLMDITETSTYGQATGGEKTFVSITGNSVYSGYNHTVGILANVRGGIYISNISTLNSGTLAVGTATEPAYASTLIAGFLVGRSHGNINGQYLKDISVDGLEVGIHVTNKGITNFGWKTFWHGGLVGYMETFFNEVKDASFSNLSVQSVLYDFNPDYSHYKINDVYNHAALKADPMRHALGGIIGISRTARSETTYWSDIKLSDVDVVFGEENETFDYERPGRASSGEYGAAIFAFRAGKGNTFISDFEIDEQSGLSATVKNVNYGAVSTASVRFGSAFAYVPALIHLSSAVNEADISVNVEDSLLGGSPYYKNLDSGVLSVAGFGAHSDVARRWENIVNRGDITVEATFDKSLEPNSFYGGTFNKGRTYDAEDKDGIRFPFEATMLNSDCAVSVGGIISGYITLGAAGYAENLANYGNIEVRTQNQQTNIFPYSTDPSATGFDYSAIGGVSSGGCYSGAYINNIYNYGDILVGGIGDLPTESHVWDSDNYLDPNSATATGLNNRIWGGLKSKAGVFVGGVVGQNLTYCASTVTNIANYGAVRVYSSAVRGIAGISGAIVENGSTFFGIGFIANLANYGEVYADSPFRPWNTAAVSSYPTDKSSGTPVLDRARVAGIIGITDGTRALNVVMIMANLMNYGFIHIENHPTKDIHNLPSLRIISVYDGNGTYHICSTDAVDLMGGFDSAAGYYWANNILTQGNVHSYMFNVGSQPSQYYAGGWQTTDYAGAASDSAFTKYGGWGVGYNSNLDSPSFETTYNQATLNTGRGSVTDLGYAKTSGTALVRGGYDSFANNVSYGSYDPITGTEASKNVYLYPGKRQDNRTAFNAPSSNYIDRFLVGYQTTSSDSFFGNYYSTKASIYRNWKQHGILTKSEQLPERFNGFIEGMQKGVYKTQIINYSESNTVDYAISRANWSFGTTLINSDSSEYKNTPVEAFDLTSDAMMHRYVVPYLYGYPFVSNAAYTANSNYKSREDAANRLSVWEKADASISLNGKELVKAGQYYFGSSPDAIRETDAKLQSPATDAEIVASTFVYDPDFVVSEGNPASDRINYSKLYGLALEYLKSDKNLAAEYDMASIGLEISRDLAKWIAVDDSESSDGLLGGLVLGGYYVRIILKGLDGFADVSLTSDGYLFRVKNEPKVAFQGDSQPSLQYTDAVFVYGQDLYDGLLDGQSVSGSWKEVTPIYSPEQFTNYIIELVGGLDAIVIDSAASDRGYLNLSSLAYQKASGFDDEGKPIWPEAFATQPIGTVDHDSFSGTSEVRNVVSIAGLEAGTYRLRLTFGQLNPTFETLYDIDWSHKKDDTGSTAGWSEHIEYLEFEILPRPIDLDWGLTDPATGAVVGSADQLFYKNSDFSIGAAFSPASAEFGAGVSLAYVNAAEPYSYEEAAALGDPNLENRPKPLDFTNAGRHEIEVRLYRDGADVTSSYSISEENRHFSYIIQKRQLQVSWNQEDAKRPYDGGRNIEIFPTIPAETLDQLEQINADKDGFEYDGNIGSEQRDYRARTVGLRDRGENPITANVEIADYYRGQPQPDGFRWSIINDQAYISIGGDRNSHTEKYGSPIGLGGLIQTHGLDGYEAAIEYQYENAAEDEWIVLVGPVTLLPGKYWFRARYAETVETPVVGLTVVKAEFGPAAVADEYPLGTFESGFYLTASDLDLPANANGTWVLSDPNQSLLAAGPHSVSATLKPNQPFLYYEKEVSFTFTIAERLDKIVTKPGSVISLNGDTHMIDGIPVGQSLTVADIRSQILNINGIIFWQNGKEVTDPAAPLATGMQLALTAAGTTPTVTYDIIVIGDVNGDGQFSLGDAATVLEYLCGTAVLDALQLAAADLDGSGAVDPLDFVDALLVKNGIETVATIRGMAPAPVSAYRKEEER